MTKKEYEKVVPLAQEVVEFAAHEIEIVRTYETDIDRLKIDDQEALELASAALREIAQKHDAIDAKRKSWVGPLKAVASDIDKTFRPVLEGLKRAEATLKDKIGKYWLVIDEERNRMLAAASEAAESRQYAKAEKIIEKAEEFEVEKTDGVGVRVEWTGEIVDEGLIPREYMSPDLKKLQAVTKAMGEKTNIPGWQILKTSVVRTTRR